MSGTVSYGQTIFNRIRSGLKLVRKPVQNLNNNNVKKCVNSFLPNRVMNYWNVLLNYVKTSSDVISFTTNFELYKTENMNKIDRGNFWKVSDEVLNRIDNKAAQTAFLLENLKVTKRKGVNIH